MSPSLIETFSPDLRRVLAPNPSAMTCFGTNTYLLGRSEIAVIDPGPKIDTHLEAILGTLETGQRITHIFVTHAHQDHCGLAEPLARETGAPIFAYGDAYSGRSHVMEELVSLGHVAPSNGVDTRFVPDRCLIDGEHIRSADWELETLHTPGHLGNHICLGWGDKCFSGDHIMAWSSTVIAAPDGDMSDYLASCAKLQKQTWSRFFPGHGHTVDAPHERLRSTVAHRRQREFQIYQLLRNEVLDAASLAQRIYVDVPPALKSAAKRNVFAHLIDLSQRSLIIALDPMTIEARFMRA